MKNLRSLATSFPVQDPNGSATPRTQYSSNQAYSLALDETTGIFYITGTQTNITVKYDGPAAWVERVEVEAFPTKQALLQKIDEIEVRTLGTKRGKKVIAPDSDR